MDAHLNARAKGFWDAPTPFLAELNTKLMLIVSEVAEAMEVLRKHYEGEVTTSCMTEAQEAEFLEEVGDIVIRAFDLAGAFTDEFGSIILAKMAKNANRPVKHGKRF